MQMRGSRCGTVATYDAGGLRSDLITEPQIERIAVAMRRYFRNTEDQKGGGGAQDALQPLHSRTNYVS